MAPQTTSPRPGPAGPTLVNLWASWCAPCLKEMPELEGIFAREQGANGTQVVGIALDDAASAQAMLQRLRIAYPNLVDAPGPADAGVRLGNQGRRAYTVLVDRRRARVEDQDRAV